MMHSCVEFAKKKSFQVKVLCRLGARFRMCHHLFQASLFNKVIVDTKKRCDVSATQVSGDRSYFMEL